MKTITERFYVKQNIFQSSLTIAYTVPPSSNLIRTGVFISIASLLTSRTTVSAHGKANHFGWEQETAFLVTAPSHGLRGLCRFGFLYGYFFQWLHPGRSTLSICSIADKYLYILFCHCLGEIVSSPFVQGYGKNVKTYFCKLNFPTTDPWCIEIPVGKSSETAVPSRWR